MFGFVMAASLVVSLQQAPAHEHRNTFAPNAHGARSVAGTPYDTLFRVEPIQVTPLPEPKRHQRKHTSPAPWFDGGLLHKAGSAEPGPCGMPIVAADPSADPKMVVVIPEGARTTAKSRAVPIGECK